MAKQQPITRHQESASTGGAARPWPTNGRNGKWKMENEGRLALMLEAGCCGQATIHALRTTGNKSRSTTQARDTKYEIRDSIHAFSLVELVIVIVIIGIIAAIAVPRFSKATTGSEAKSVAATLKVVNDAVQMYKAEHDCYPGTSGTCDPVISGDMFANQLTSITDAAGNPNAGNLGPYLRAVPPNPFSTKAKTYSYCPSCSSPQPPSYTEGWIFDVGTGDFNIALEATETDGVYDLCDLIRDAAPAQISYNHPSDTSVCAL